MYVFAGEYNDYMKDDIIVSSSVVLCMSLKSSMYGPLELGAASR